MVVVVGGKNLVSFGASQGIIPMISKYSYLTAFMIVSNRVQAEAGDEYPADFGSNSSWESSSQSACWESLSISSTAK